MISRELERNVPILGVFCVAMALYLNSLQGEFIYDDGAFIVENHYIKDLHCLPRYFTDKLAHATRDNFSIYRPLRVLTFALDYHFWRLNPFGFHFTNVVLHAACGMLSYWLLLLLFGDRSLAFLAGLFFVAHPVQTEAVAWVSSRADLLYSLFFLAGFISFLKRKDALCALFFLLGLLSKESAIMLPVVLAVYQLMFFPRQKIKVARYLPFLVIAASYSLIRYLVLETFSQRSWWGGSFLVHLLTVTSVFNSYVRLLVWPLHLNLLYEFPLVRSAWAGSFLFSLLLICVVVFLFVFFYRRRPVISFGLFWIMATLLPTSNIVPIGGLLSEHYLYLACLGFSLVLADLLLVFRRLKGPVRFPRLYVFISTAIVTTLLGLYALRTIERNQDWQRNAAFWEKTVRMCPLSYKAHHNVANEYIQQGLREKARRHFAEAVRLNPRAIYSLYSLGVMSFQESDFARAEDYFKEAIELAPKFSDAITFLGMVYLEEGRVNEAIQRYQEAIRRDPKNSSAYRNLGLALMREDKAEEAMSCFRRAVQLAPERPAGHNSLGIALAREGKILEAIKEYEEAITLDPEFSLGYANLGVAFRYLGDRGIAKGFFRKAIEIDPRGRGARTAIENLRELKGLPRR